MHWSVRCQRTDRGHAAAICDLDLSGLERVESPRGFGRDRRVDDREDPSRAEAAHHLRNDEIIQGSAVRVSSYRMRQVDT